MTIERGTEALIGILDELRGYTREAEWVEFKVNNFEASSIGEYISALANSAALLGKTSAWMAWGIEDESHDVVGTNFDPSTTKVGNEELENWLLRLLAPKIDFCFHQFSHGGFPVVLLEISPAYRHPVQFQGIEYIRIGTYKKKLKDHREKERALWKAFDQTPFEEQSAASDISEEELLRLLDYPAYFELLNLPLPESREGILRALAADQMISKGESGRWTITNLGATLFARRFTDFRSLRRKAVRVVLYEDDSKTSTVREQEGGKGYASGFEGLIEYTSNLLPSNEVIGQALRKTVPMFPPLAVRELVANSLIHQNFLISGAGPTIEIFSNRMEITNPGTPLVSTDRFLDNPPRSRNEMLASFLRRVGICEERGTGIDKVVWQTELFQLPAPLIESFEHHTRVTLFAHRDLSSMDKEDRIRACYLHACLRRVQRDFMTNTSLRQRLGIEPKNSATASRIISETVSAGLVRAYDESAGKKYMKYVPWWD